MCLCYCAFNDFFDLSKIIPTVAAIGGIAYNYTCCCRKRAMVKTDPALDQFLGFG